jgi:hypothetical protein
MSSGDNKQESTANAGAASGEILVGYYALLFVDILAQKGELKKTAQLPENEDQRDAFIESMRKTSGVVTSFRDLFDRFFDPAADQVPPFPTDTEEERKFIELCKRTKIKKQCFSDTMIYYAWVMEEPDCLVISAIHQLLSAAAAGFFLPLSYGLPCRAAIEAGTAREFGKGDLYGYAMQEAYRLENQIAQFPRVVVGQELLQFIGRDKIREGNSTVENYRRALANRCNDWLLQDLDGVTILDYAGPQTKEMFPALEGAIDRAITFVDREWQRFKTAGATSQESQKLATRYYLMRQYLQWRKATVWA